MVQDFKPSLDTTDVGTPLRIFEGMLEKYESIPGRDEQNQRDYMVIQFSFTDVEVIESTEPYPFPIAQIKVSYSTKTKTKWDALAKSVKTTLGPEASLDGLVGKRQQWAMQPATLRVMDDETKVWGDGQVDCWKVVKIEGVAPPEDLTDHIVGLADGKDEKAFNQAFLTDDKLRTRPDLITALTERKLVEPLITAGKLTRDAEGVLHKA